MKNTQTKSFRIISTKSNRFLGFFNVSDNLSASDYEAVEKSFEDAFNLSLKAKSSLSLEVKGYKSAGDNKESII
jgi:hypothetical protein